MKVNNDHRSKFSNSSNWKEEAWKKNQGFNGIRTRDLRVAGALLYQLSYEATHWERGQFIEFISLVRSEIICNGHFWSLLKMYLDLHRKRLVYVKCESSRAYHGHRCLCFIFY